METHAEKAQRLVDERRVNIVFPGHYVTEAYVQGEHKSYAVVLYTSGRFSCPCPWGKVHWFTDDLCAHALAVKLAAGEATE